MSWRASVDMSRATSRAMSNARSVSSASQRLPSQRYHRDHASMYRHSGPFRRVNSAARRSSQYFGGSSEGSSCGSLDAAFIVQLPAKRGAAPDALALRLEPIPTMAVELG